MNMNWWRGRVGYSKVDIVRVKKKIVERGIER